ncbi:hypothetical protein [Argonema antarcticum]|uniref:hypothetical protein n=1 Tax=Argonema antarcticum TaxID=2942763 RepID=UPI002011D834|nr:hypothetical protein [Argonema antarcticum]MCL1470217.1 hypothetical protein [Argonema antarcticum A004/B2]
MDVYIKNKKIRLKPNKAIGKGGEADVYDIGNGKALKLFKQPDHSDYQNNSQQQRTAQERLDEHQFKLRLFPSNLPKRVICPQELVNDALGIKILGYTMEMVAGAEVLLKYSDRTFRQSGIANQIVVEIFRDLHTTVATIHQAGVVVGDFNDLNVLIKEKEAYLIDADSFQFVSFPCRVFTTRFVDPLLCDRQSSKPILVETYSTDSDWYAYSVMLMQSLLFVDPYGGVYRPKDPSKRIPHEARSLQGISIFNPEVKYPKPAIPYKVLPDELLHYFYQVFEEDKRGEFARSLLDNLQWTTCKNCGAEHARNSCPNCSQTIPVSSLPKQAIVRGTVTATRIFSTEGIILFTALQGDKLCWLYHEKGKFKREDDTVILSGNLDPHLQFRIQGKSTLIGKQGQVITLNPGKSPSRLAVETFDVNETNHYWTYSGQLLRNGQLGSEYIGDVLAEQTRFWVGSHFGFGFYRAGNLNVAFVFDANKRGINDTVKIPSFTGQLIDANCTCTADRCWFFISTQEQGQTINHVYIIRSDGSIEGTAAAKAGDNSWLSTLHGKFAAGNFLLAATDDGIVRVASQNGQIIQTKEFPDTEPFVDANSHLFASQQGLYVVKSQQILMLKIT